MTTTTRLAELLAKATKGPYAVMPVEEDDEPFVYIVAGDHFDDEGNILTPTRGMVAMTTLSPTEIDARDFQRAKANAALYVKAVNALPTLLATIASQAAEIGRLRAENERAHKLLIDGALPSLLTPDESAALVDFVKAALTPQPSGDSQ